MKMVYLDTNLYIALIKHNDSNYSKIQRIIQQPHLSFITSTVTLVELSSVISREFNKLNLDYIREELHNDSIESIPPEEIIYFLIDYLISKTKTKIISDSQIEILNYFSQEIRINPAYKIAILESSKIQLRTLDLLHYAYSMHFYSLQSAKIDYILSGDNNFISKGRSYPGTKNFTFIDPEMMIELECK